MTHCVLRLVGQSDSADVADVFTQSRALLKFLPKLHAPQEDAEFTERHVFSNCDVTVAERDGQIVSFVALQRDWLDHLYVRPEAIGTGSGSQLLLHARAYCPYLQLWCFEQNDGARRFYERHGFKIAERTNGFSNEEKCSDIRYVWARV